MVIKLAKSSWKCIGSKKVENGRSYHEVTTNNHKWKTFICLNYVDDYDHVLDESCGEILAILCSRRILPPIRTLSNHMVQNSTISFKGKIYRENKNISRLIYFSLREKKTTIYMHTCSIQHPINKSISVMLPEDLHHQQLQPQSKICKPLVANRTWIPERRIRVHISLASNALSEISHKGKSFLL